MDSHHRQLTRDLDAIEVLCVLRAWPGARWRLQSVEHTLWEFLQAQRARDGGRLPVTDDLLWKLGLQVRGSVEGRDTQRVSAAISDLKAALVARVSAPPADGPAAVH